MLTLHVLGPVTAVSLVGLHPVVATKPTLSLAVRGDRIARGTKTGDVILTGRGGKRVLATHGGPVTAVAFDTTATLLATGSKRGITSIWDLTTGRRLHALRGRGHPITSVALSPDGRQLLTASVDHEVRLWNVRAGTLERIFRWHVGPVGSAAFSRDAHWIVTAGPGTAGVGEISSDQRVRGLRGPETMRPLVGAAFAGRDGRSIVAASRDGTIRMYRCDFCGDIDALMQLARRRLSLR
jgi:WD40 repeat protein